MLNVVPNFILYVVLYPDISNAPCGEIVLIPTFPEFPVLQIVFVPTIFVQALYTVKSGALVILL